MKNKSIYPWVVVGLLWIVALLNYMDRQMLSTMQEAMKVDIDIPISRTKDKCNSKNLPEQLIVQDTIFETVPDKKNITANAT